MHKLYCRLTALAAVALLTSACGGGGGGSSSAEPTPVPTPTPPPQSLRIAGTITASSNQAVDGDTNDPAGPVRANDSVATAQPIPNPITLGGYVNQPGSGAPGRSTDSGDTDDYFRVDLLAGQSITMLVADFQQADADLYLYDTQGRILDFSIESAEVETLVVPRDGSYVVNAFAFEGATNYILAIGDQGGAVGQGQRHHAILPWQSVIKFKPGAEPDGPIFSRLRRMGMEQRAGGPGRARLMGMRRGLAGGPETIARSGPAVEKLGQVEDSTLRARLETLLAIKALKRDPRIEYAEPNYKVRAMAVPNDSGFAFQWHYPLIDLPAAWDTTAGSPEVIVAVIDTGILSGHPDLGGQWVAGYDFVRSAQSGGDGDGIDPDPEDTGGGRGGASSSFHGTH
ncbi:MAG: S8 family peptidase, partial [Halioglobus sp.]